MTYGRNILRVPQAHATEPLQLMNCNVSRAQTNNCTNGKDTECTAFVASVRACAKNRDLLRGTKIHDNILKRGLIDKCLDDLVTMYAKCGALEKARELFDMQQSKDVFTWTALIAGYAQKGQGQDALNCYERMRREGPSPNAVTFTCILKACASMKAVDKGQQIHDEIAKSGVLGQNVMLGTALVDMYAKCGVLVKAHRALEELPVRDVVSWNALITGYAQQGQGEQALKCYEQMQHDGLSPDDVTFICILKACGSMGASDKGKQIHDKITKWGLLGKNVVLDTALVDMYAKCGDLAKAQEALDGLHVRDVVSWNALISGYVESGQGRQALATFEQMQCDGLSPNAATFVCVLKACALVGAADRGKQIHDEINKQGSLGKDTVVGTALVDMYAKCGVLAKAQQVLEELPVRDIASWNALITGYTEHGQSEQAIKCFERMQSEGLFPDGVTLICILKASGTAQAADKGEKIHDEIVRRGLLATNNMLGNALVDMYAKCGALSKAQQVFEELPFRDILSWSMLITGYAQQGHEEQALNLFEQMKRDRLSPSAIIFVCMLKVCGSIGAIEKGEQIHDEVTQCGLLGKDVVLGTALVDMYAKCGLLAKAQQVLEKLPARDVVAWNALIAGHAQHGQGEQALNCYERMQSEGVTPNEVTLIFTLKACGSIKAADKGEEIYEKIRQQGLLGHDIMLGNAVVDMYVKCGALFRAQEVLEELPCWDVVSWSTLIAGYAQQGQGEQAMTCFKKMQSEGLSPNAVTFACMLKACGSIGAVDKGEIIHQEVARQGLLESSLALCAALVDMYAACGALEKAQRVLEELPARDVACWSTLIAGYAQQGQCEEALQCFECMQNEGLSPDAATFSSMLRSCSLLGSVEDAQSYFGSMSTRCGLKANLEQYTCLVDVFGRAGHLDKAVGVIEGMPLCDSVVWCALLSACREWGDVNFGRWAFEHAVQVDQSEPTAYALMAAIYAATGMQEDVQNIQTMQIRNKAWKRPMPSWKLAICENTHSRPGA